MMEWPADRVERRPIGGLLPYARNARTHSEEQITQIAASIREWGWTMPVLVDEEGGIIAGHGRVLAARKLGLADVPVMVARGWTRAQKQAYVLADNTLTLNAGWDDALLPIELADLAEMGFDLSLTGFGEKEIAALSAFNEGLTDPDEVPELPAHPISEPDLWILGRHRLLCGDATVATDVDPRARRRLATSDGHRSALCGRIRSSVAQPCCGRRNHRTKKRHREQLAE
jgi:ParB-like chromosome segregation protein Spo0J